MSTDAPLKPNPAELPYDPAFLKPLIVQLFETLQSRERRIQQLEHHMDLLLRRVFGKSSDKLDPRQLVMAFAELSAKTTPSTTSEPTAESERPTANTAKKQGHGRRRTLGTLVRVALFVIVHPQKKYARREQLLVTSDDPLEQT